MTRFRRHCLGLALLSALAACGQSSPATSGEPPLATGKSRQRADGWYEIRPEAGVSVLLRDGWSASRMQDSKGPIRFTGPNGAQAIVWPMFVAAGAAMPDPAAVLTSFARQIPGRFNWGRPFASGTSAVRMVGQSGNSVAIASFAHNRTPAGMSGYWFMTSAPKDQYGLLQPVFAKLVQGVRFYGSTAATAAKSAPSAAQLRFTSWKEPNEGAYVTQVPQGWQVRGGIMRPDPLRLLDPVEMQSPDGKLYVFSGDPKLPVFKTPTRMEASLGMAEGSRNGAAILMRYRPAAQYLPTYLQQRFGQQCPDFRIETVQDQPQLAEPANRQLAAGTAPGSFQRVDVALASFRCGSGSKGMVQMATYITGSDGQMGTEGFGIWMVSGVAGFVAPPQRMVEAGQVVIKLLSARQINPQWAQSNQQMVAQINTYSRQAAAEMSAQIARNAPSMASSSSGSSTTSTSLSDDLSRQWQNSTMDQTDVIDQSTGTRYKVESGSNYYWINQQGTAIVGTNAPSQPGIDYNAMTQLP